MSYLDNPNQDPFIGTVHPKHPHIKVIERNSIRDKWGIALYSIHCQKCAKDPELHGNANYLMTKTNFISGNVPCGCSDRPKWTKEQFTTLILRKCVSNQREERFIGFVDENVNAKTKIILSCKIHGEWRNSCADKFLHSDQGCPVCANTQKKTTHEFTKISKAVHGNKYNYKNCIYKNNNSKVLISCHIHGDFKQTPAAHINGSGCPKCAKHGFNPISSKFIYVCILENKTSGDKFCGYGITNDPIIRKRTHTKTAKIKGYDILNFVWVEVIDGFEAINIETYIKQNYIANNSVSILGFKKENADYLEYENILKLLISRSIKFYN